MNLNIIKSSVSVARRVGKVVIRCSPELMVAGGIVGGAATTVLACKKTRTYVFQKLEYDNMVDTLDELEEGLANGDEPMVKEDGTPYLEKDIASDRIAIKRDHIVDCFTAYAPVVALGTLSALSILCGVRVFRARYITLAAAYGSLERGFSLYRQRVIEEQGEEADWRYRTGAIIKKLDREVIDEETGETKKKKIKMPVVGEESEATDYTINYLREATWLSEYKDMSRVLSDIVDYTHSMNSILRAEKMLTLNDARKIMHLMPTTAGQFVGWTVDGEGDGVVDLRPKVVYDEYLGHDTVILDPNVDGIIVNKIDNVVKELRGF